MKKLLLLASAALALIVFGDTRPDIRVSRKPTPTRSSIRTLIRICAGDRSGRRVAAARPRRPACARSPTCSTWARPAAACGRPRTTASLVPGVRRADSDRIDRRARRRRLNPNVVYAGTGSEAIRSNVISAAASTSRPTPEDVAYAGLRKWADRPAQDSPEEPRHRLRRRRSASRSAGEPDRGVYRTKDGGKTGRKCCSSTIRPARCRWRSTGRTPNELYAGARRGAAQARGRSSAAVRRRKAASTK